MLEAGTKAPDFTLPNQNGVNHSLSDTELEVIKAYDVLKRDKDGNPTKSMSRSTYLIDGDGIIARAFGGVKPKENAAQMLDLV